MARLFAAMITAALLMVAVVSVLWLVLAAAVVAGVVFGVRRVLITSQRRAGARRHQRAELLARADIQHSWYLDGDPRGVYGRYVPAALGDR